MAEVNQTASKNMSYFKPLQSMLTGKKFIKWVDNDDYTPGVDMHMDPKGYILYWRDFNKVII